MSLRNRIAPTLLLLTSFALSLPACDLREARPTYAVSDRGADTDGDGAADIDDACPKDAEDGLPPKANDGCPASDWDHDGILLADDQCPNAKEDGAAPSPKDGCPMNDADGDGVADSLDKCSDKAEDNIDPEPNDGCPAPDSDGDLIVDSRDKCPNEPETVNEYRDSDGCPDQEPTEVTWDDSSSAIYVPASKRVQFASDSADLPAGADATIAALAGIMKERPEIQRLEIEGHASTKGDTGYNTQLTERRAHTVGRALVSAGVDAKRLVPVGYGEYCPAVQTPDDVDEPKNRRVLLKTVQVSGVWRDVPRGCWKAQAAGVDPTKRKAGVAAATAQPPPPRPISKPTGGT